MPPWLRQHKCLGSHNRLRKAETCQAHPLPERVELAASPVPLHQPPGAASQLCSNDWVSEGKVLADPNKAPDLLFCRSFDILHSELSQPFQRQVPRSGTTPLLPDDKWFWFGPARLNRLQDRGLGFWP